MSQGSSHRVVVLVDEGSNPFEMGVATELFGLRRPELDRRWYDFAVCAVQPGPVTSSLGFGLLIEHGLDRVAEADLVAVPAMKSIGEPTPPEALQALRDAIDRGARVMSVCYGAFALGEAGLLDGRECTTHWSIGSALTSSQSPTSTARTA